jgi:hypothetical protein
MMDLSPTNTKLVQQWIMQCTTIWTKENEFPTNFPPYEYKGPPTIQGAKCNIHLQVHYKQVFIALFPKVICLQFMVRYLHNSYKFLACAHECNLNEIIWYDLQMLTNLYCKFENSKWNINVMVKLMLLENSCVYDCGSYLDIFATRLLLTFNFDHNVLCNFNTCKWFVSFTWARIVLKLYHIYGSFLFFLSILWSRWIANHPQGDLAKFGYE